MIKPFDYHTLQQRLLMKAGENLFPLKAMFELTYRCNLRCRYCYVVDEDDKRKELSTAQIYSILDTLAASGTLNIGFTGGEPFMREDIIDILAYAKKLGLNVILLTNGSLITPEKADALAKLGLNKIDVSFHTTDEKVFDWFVRVPGAQKRVLEAAKLLRDRKVDVYIKTTGMTINKDDMVNIRHMAVERFGAHIRWGPAVTPRWDGGKDVLQFRLSAEEIYQILEHIDKDVEIEYEKMSPIWKKEHAHAENAENKEKKPAETNIDNRCLYNCGAGKTEVVISPYGEMRLCLDIPEPKYDLLKGDFTEGWKMLSDHVKNTPPGPSYQCRDCEVAAYCGFCPARGYLECGDASACPPYLKETAIFGRMMHERKTKDKKDAGVKTANVR